MEVNEQQQQTLEKLNLLKIEDPVDGQISNSDTKTSTSSNVEKMYNEYQKIDTLRDMKKFCVKHDISIPKNLTFASLKNHVYKLYASQFRAIQNRRNQERPPRHMFDYYIVIDFECTCWVDNTKKIQEIIEFPAVLIDAKKNVIVDTFQEYVKPRINPQLTEFCVDFTGITQETVDNAKSLPHVILLFRKWLKKNELHNPSKYLIVTDGRADIGQFLNLGLLIHDLPFPHELRAFADLKILFKKYHKKSAKFLKMMEFFELEVEGRHHCGLDDAKNIARLVMEMCNRNCKIHPTNRMIPAHLVEEYGGTCLFKTPLIPTTRTAYCYSKVNKFQFTTKAYLVCDDCVADSCEAASLYR